MWVKICANTTLGDALLAAQLGADAVGFVFAPSARQVVSEQVAHITPHLPAHLERIGVFPAWRADRILSAVAEAGLTGVQLHAAFDANLARALKESLGSKIKLIQAIHWPVEVYPGTGDLLLQQIEQIKAFGLIDRILVDSKVGSASGGTGTPFNWPAAELLFRAHSQLILAGGLSPQNILQAIARLRPWGVDVASGVEAEPGRKDPEKVKAFIAEAKSSQV